MTEKTADEKCARMNIGSKLRRQCKLAQKVCELSLADYAFNKYPPSLTASCALRIASGLLKTEQGLAALAITQLQDDLCESPDSSENHSLIMKSNFLPVSQESYHENLAQECKDNLELLVSLNQETLEVMSLM